MWNENEESDTMLGDAANNDTFQNYWIVNTNNIDLALFECGYEKCDAHHFWGPGPKGYYLLHYVLSGKGIYKHNGNTFHIGAGDVFYIPKNGITFYQADAQDPWEYRWIGFNGTKPPLIMQQTIFSEEAPVHHAKNHEDFFLSNMQSIYKTALGVTSDLHLTGRLYIFLSELIDRFPKENTCSIPSGEVEYVNRAIRYIQMNYTNNCSISRMSKELNLNRSYIFKLFKKHVGISPMGYIKQMRMDHACTLLRMQKYTMEEIAISVGYNDALYFTKTFKEVKHMTPKEYILSNSL